MFILKAPQGVSDKQAPNGTFEVFARGLLPSASPEKKYSEGIYRNSQVFPNKAFL
jgi:hypothetical protein